MERLKKIFWSTFVIYLTIGSVQLYAQQTRTHDGVVYTVIAPNEFAFNADARRLSVGQRFVIDGSVLSVSGATLMLRDTGANTFILGSPMNLPFGANVTIFVEITRVGIIGTEARVVHITGPGVSAAQVQRSTGTRTLDGVEFQIITPVEFALNADAGRLSVGQRYVIDGSVLSISGATLMLRDTGANTFTLSAPSSLGFGANVRVFVEITRVGIIGAEARVVRMENR